MEIIVPLITFVSGIILAYIGFRFQVSRDRLNTKRERLLINISKVERYLNLTLEMRTIKSQIQGIRKKQQVAQNEFERIKKRHVEFYKRYEAYQIKFSKIEKSLLQPKKKISVRDKSMLKSEMKSIIRQLEIDEKRLAEEEKEISKTEKNQDDAIQVLMMQKDRVDEMLKELSLLDIVVICRMIDPSNRLRKYLYALIENDQKLFTDIENLNWIRKSQDLRYKIFKLLENKIK